MKILSLFLLPFAAHAANTAASTIACDSVNSPFGIRFAVPARLGELPVLDFDYPVQVTQFSFRDGNLLLIATDKADPSRVRVMVSAQLDRSKNRYLGQMVSDEGNHEVQLDNGPATCRVE